MTSPFRKSIALVNAHGCENYFSVLKRNPTGFVVMLLLLFASAARAVPQIPFSPLGTAQISGANVPEGTVISAWAGGTKWRETTTVMYSGESWYWNFDIPGDDLSTPDIVEGCTPNQVVSSKIGNAWANETALWASGGSPRLNLTAPLPVPPAPRSFRDR